MKNALAKVEFIRLETSMNRVRVKVDALEILTEQNDFSHIDDANDLINELEQLYDLYNIIRNRVKSKVYSKKDCKKYDGYTYIVNNAKFYRTMNYYWSITGNYMMQAVQKCRETINRYSCKINALAKIAIEAGAHLKDIQEFRADQYDIDDMLIARQCTNEIMEFLKKKYDDGELKITDNSKEFVGNRSKYNAIYFNGFICIEANDLIALIRERHPGLVTNINDLEVIIDDFYHAGYIDGKAKLPFTRIPWVARLRGQTGYFVAFIPDILINFKL